jgi:VanZ family protein
MTFLRPFWDNPEDTNTTVKFLHPTLDANPISRIERVTLWIGRFLYYWLPPLVLSGGVLFMASDYGATHNFGWVLTILKSIWPRATMTEIYQIHSFIRKFMHFLTYAALLGVYVRALWGHLGLRRRPAILVGLLICLVIASADEGRQALYPSRQGRPSDVLLDMSGALIAALLLWPFLREPQPDDTA